MTDTKETSVNQKTAPPADIIRRWKHALPNVALGQRDIVQDTIACMERMTAALADIARATDPKTRELAAWNAMSALNGDPPLFPEIRRK